MLVCIVGVSAASCEDAALARPDARADDARLPDAGTEDVEVLDATSDAPDTARDLGTDADTRGDGGTDAAPPAPRGPVPPRPPLALRSDWIDLEAADLASVGPMVTPPAAPSFEPCPLGWTARSMPAGDPITCEPFAPTAWSVCTPGQARFPGTPACAPLGNDCPTTDRWPSGLPAVGVLYVDSSAPAGGTGTSAASPLRTIGSALGAATSGTIVALATGTYVESVTVDRPGVSLRGACAAATSITPSATNPAVRVVADGVVLEDIALSGGSIGLSVEAGAGTLTVHAVEVRGSLLSGVNVVSGRLVADRLRVRSVGTDGVLLTAGTSSFHQIEISDAGNAISRSGIRIESSGATATVEDAVLADIGNDGISASAGSLDLQRVIVTRATSTGIYVPGGTVTGEHVIVRDTRTNDPIRGYGATVGDRGALTLDHVLIEGNRDNGAWSTGAGTVLTLRDAVVRDTRRISATGPATEGVQCFGASHCVLERVALLRNDDAALIAKNPGTVMSAQDITVTNSTARPLQGIIVIDGADATLQRAFVHDVGGPGVRLASEAVFEIGDLRVENVVGTGDDSAGIFVDGASGTASNVWVEHVDGPGIWVRDGTRDVTTLQGTIELADVRVAGTGASPAELGSGLLVEDGGEINGARALVSDTTESAVVARGDQSIVDVSDLAAVAAPEMAAIEVSESGTVHATRVVLRAEGHSAVSAVGRGSSVVLRDLAIRGSGAGAAGLEIEDAALELYGALLEWSDGPAVRASGLGVIATLEDLVARPFDGAPMGPGLWLRGGADGTVARLDIDGSVGVAILLDGDGTDLDADEVFVHALRADAQGIAYGLVAMDGATLSGSAVATEGTIGLGAGAFGAGSSIDLDHVRIDSVAASEGGPAVGAGSFAGGELAFATFVITDADECGLEVGAGSALSGTDGLVTESAIGLCTLDPSFDVDALRRGVQMLEVGTDVDSSARATPASPTLAP